MNESLFHLYMNWKWPSEIPQSETGFWNMKTLTNAMNKSQSVDNSPCELNTSHVTLKVMPCHLAGKSCTEKIHYLSIYKHLIGTLQLVFVVIDILLNCIFSIVTLFLLAVLLYHFALSGKKKRNLSECQMVRMTDGFLNSFDIQKSTRMSLFMFMASCTVKIPKSHF